MGPPPPPPRPGPAPPPRLPPRPPPPPRPVTRPVHPAPTQQGLVRGGDDSGHPAGTGRTLRYRAVRSRDPSARGRRSPVQLRPPTLPAHQDNRPRRPEPAAHHLA